MATATPIVLADAQSTPVNHTFIPLGKDANDVFWFEDQSQASPVGFWRISVDMRRPNPAAPGQNTANRVYRAKIGLHEPILETVSNSTVSGIAPAPTIAYISRALVEFILPERTSLQNRKDLRKMFGLLIGNSNIIAVVEDLNFLS